MYRKIRIRLTFFITWAKMDLLLILIKLIPDKSYVVMFYVTVMLSKAFDTSI